MQDIRVWTTNSSTIAQTDAATVDTETRTIDNMGSTVRRKSSEYKQGLVAYIVPTEDIWTIIMTATFCLLIRSAENRPRNRCKSIFETLYITSFFLLHIHTMLLRDVDSHQTSMASPRACWNYVLARNASTMSVNICHPGVWMRKQRKWSE